MAVNDSTIFAGTEGGVFYSNNDGSNWAKITTDLTNGHIFSLLSSGKTLVIGTENGVVVSVNNGTVWVTEHTGLTKPKTEIFALAIAGTTIIAGTERGIYLSSDNGHTWTHSLKKQIILSLTESGTNIFAGTPDGVLLSTDAGISWAAESSGLTNTEVYSLAVSGNNIYSGTFGGGVFVSSNNGDNWSILDSGLTDLYVFALAANETNLFAGTGSSSVFTHSLNQVITNTNELSAYRSSLSCYPNPFDYSTTISFSLPQAEKASLKIYDVAGKLIFSLANQKMSAGNHQLNWNAKDKDGKNVPSGIYFLNLQAGNKSETIELEVQK